MSAGDQSNQAPDLEFSRKYTAEHAQRYFEKHQRGFWRKLSNYREQVIARGALRCAGNPQSVLDLPCGTGRFWETLAQEPDREIYAADLSKDMVETGLSLRPRTLAKRIEAFTCSAFEIPKPDSFVECVFSMRLLHHIGDEAHRVAVLKEFARVAANSVIVSLWVDGNLKAWRRCYRERNRSAHQYQNRFLLPAVQFKQECLSAGLAIRDRLNLIPGYSMWAIYVLEKRT